MCVDTVGSSKHGLLGLATASEDVLGYGQFRTISHRGQSNKVWLDGLDAMKHYSIVHVAVSTVVLLVYEAGFGREVQLLA